MGKKSATNDYHKYIYCRLYEGNVLVEPQGSVSCSLEIALIDSIVLPGHSKVNLVVVLPCWLPVHQQY